METNSFIETDTLFRQYTSEDTIVKYSRATAGYGINYLLDHDYKSLYLKALQSLPAAARQKGIRILEFGCGAGMNLLHLVSVLSRGGNNVESAIGTDFSPVLIEAAVQEAKNYLRAEDRRKVQFCVARNETLIDNLSSALGKDRCSCPEAYAL
ncbi:MAG: class I SAM-dependent methyltransferase [Verrucomicrobia bacterium]|nr:MAG: class I SAM-dependent methyltransferase [Verrucomicrobiota bacterium]